MSWSSSAQRPSRRAAALRSGLLAFALLGGAGLSACTFSPVYGDHGVATEQSLKLNFAAPKTRLEQVVYQQLALRFGTSDAPDAPRVSISVGSSTRTVAQSITADPEAPALATATGTITISRNGKVLLTATRQASSSYSTSSQALANAAAETDAAESAARGLAESLRLTILSALAGAPDAR